MTMVLPALVKHLRDTQAFSPWHYWSPLTTMLLVVPSFGVAPSVLIPFCNDNRMSFAVLLLLLLVFCHRLQKSGQNVKMVEVLLTIFVALIPVAHSSSVEVEGNSTSTTVVAPDGYGHGSIVPTFSLGKAISITFIYGLIFVTGVVGNICTCVVIARNKYMHTATNFYLFSLAVSDLLLLILGLPQEIYQIWVPIPYIFGETFCIIRGLAAETSTNASILTITAFTVERYLAICHPLRSHTMSRLSRAVRFILLIWIIGGLCAVPIALQFGIVYQKGADNQDLPNTGDCLVKKSLERAFEVTTFVFFLLPMSVITALYILIGLKLRGPALKHEGSTNNGCSKADGQHLRCQHQRLYHRPLQPTHSYSSTRSEHPNPASINSRRAVVKMLVAVVVAFFVCWAPFHAQRLMAIYASTKPLPIFVSVYEALVYVSGVLYYVSATINPILYHIMSLKFRMAFKDTLSPCFGRRPIRSGKFNSLSHFASTLRSRPAPAEVTETTVMEPFYREEGAEEPTATSVDEKQKQRCTNGGVKSSLLGVGSCVNSNKSKKRVIPIMDPATTNRIVKTDSISNSSMQMVEDEAVTALELSNFMAQLNDSKYGHMTITNGNNHHTATPC